MMKNNVKILSVFLSLIMVLSVLTVVPVGAIAPESDETAVTVDGVSENAKKSPELPGSDADLADTGAESEVAAAGAGVIHFDAASAGWSGARAISFYIYEIGGANLTEWGAKNKDLTSNTGDIWSFDAAAVGVVPGKVYGISFLNLDTFAHTADLLFDTSCFGDTAYANRSEKIESPFDASRKSMVARWYHSSLGPIKQITSSGNVVGESIPSNTSAYQMLVDFLASKGTQSLTNALSFNGKNAQTTIDNVAIDLGLTRDDVYRAINDAKTLDDGIDWSLDWNYNLFGIVRAEPVDPPDEDGLIFFDATSAGWQYTSAVFFDIYDMDNHQLPAESTPDEIRGTRTYNDVWFFNAQKCGMLENQLYYIIFRNAVTNERTASLLIDSSCYGDTAYCDGSIISDSINGSDDSPSYLATFWNHPHSFSMSGKIGSCTWKIENDLLTISGNYPLENDIRIKAIWNQIGFTDAIVKKSVKSIGANVFKDCAGLKTVTIGNTVQSIGESAFSDCSSLETVNIPNAVKVIGNNAFYNCDKLTSVTLPNSVNIIGENAFSGCDALASVTMSGAVTDIGERAFYDCPSLTSVTIPDSVTNIDTKAFGWYRDETYSLNRKVNNFTIKGYEGSMAETYARNNGFRFVSLLAKTGDADGDGEITVMDATEVQYLLAGLKPHVDESLIMFADVDQNGLLEIIDVTYILRHVAGEEVPYTIG